MSTEVFTPFITSSVIQNDQDLEISIAHQVEKLSLQNKTVANCCVPEFSCHQTPEELVFVFNITNLDKDSINLDFGSTVQNSSASCHVTFKSKTLQNDLRHYSLFLKFLPECLVLPGKELVTVCNVNSVICLKKHENSLHHWECFYYGLDSKDATFQQSLTVSSLQHKLDILQKEAAKIVEANDGVPDDHIQISYIDDDRVEFTFEEVETYRNCTGNGFDDNVQSSELSYTSSSGSSDNSPDVSNSTDGKLPSESSIVSKIITTPFRRFRSVSESGDEIHLKGILKNVRRRSHTMSESSDDISWSSQDHPGLDSDIPEEEPSDTSNVKKSVHFNDNVYRSFFRSNSSILGQREKNRKKQKKKLDIRRRRSSEGESDSNSMEADDKNDLQQKMDFGLEETLDINQNYSSSSDNMGGGSSDCPVELENDINSGQQGSHFKIKNGDKKRRKKKNETSNDEIVDNDNDNLDAGVIVLTSSPEAHVYQRHRRYFSSRHRHISI